MTVFITVSCSPKTDAGSEATPEYDEAGMVPIAVEVMTVSKGLLVPEIRSGGVVEGAREAWVVSETEGLVIDVNYSPGDRVESGQVLLAVDSDLALRNKNLAEQQYLTVLLEYEAAGKSYESGSMSALNFSRVKDKFFAAEASRAAAIDSYENTFLKAPFSGVVALTDRSIGIGTLLSRGIRVARIVDDSSFKTELSVGEGQVLLVREGSVAEILGSDGTAYTGRVSAVSGGSDPATGSYAVIVEWTPGPGDTLRSGMSVNVSIKVEREREEIIVPVSAVRVRAGQEWVFVETGGKAEARRVTTGGRLGERIEILDGLAAGEILITSGLASVTPGAAVAPKLIGESGDVR